DLLVAAALEEYAFGPGWKFFPDPDEIVPLVMEVKVVRKAVAERVIRRGVTGESTGCSGEIDRQRPRGEDDGNRRRRRRAKPPGLAASLEAPGHLVVEGHRLSVVRKLRSCFRIPARLVARDVSCRSSYNFSIFRTKAAMS